MKYKKIVFPLLALLIFAVIIYLVKTNVFWHKVNAIISPQEQTNVDSSKEVFTITLPEHSNERTIARDTVGDVNTKDTSSVKQQKQIKAHIIAYYFHPTARCPTCINIENFTEEVIKTLFAKENKTGLISFKQLNIEDSVNEHYIEDYKLEFSSVILAKFVNKKQTKWKNLENVWKFANDKEQFFKYASIEIKSFLKEQE